MDKKIGLITFHDTNNFGSWLQTYALYKKLYDIGADIEVIDYQCDELIKREKMTGRKCIESLQQKSLENYQNLFKRLVKQGWFYVYTRKYMRLSKLKYNKRSIDRANSDYDVFLVGSDLVWDTRITGSDYIYMLNFVECGKKRISYAASLGYEEVPENQKAIYTKFLNRFQFITVREDGAKKTLEKILHVPIEVVSDPTMLLSKKEWLSFVKRVNKYGDYVLLYFIDDKEKLLHLARGYARKHGCKVLVISGDSSIRDLHVSPKNVSEFLSLIYYAKKVFTASYHGLLFSIYFEKQFAYCNRKPEDRMRSVARKLEIEDFEIQGEGFDLEYRADFKEINEKVEGFRESSLFMLKKIIGER